MRLLRTIALAVVCCLLPPSAITQQAPAAGSAEEKEVKEAFDKIKKAHEKGAKDDSDEIKKLKTEAIKLVDKHYKIPQDNVDGEPTYDPGMKKTQEGETIPSDRTQNKKGNKAKVTIGERAFSSPGWLASSKLHEIVGHGTQAMEGRWPTSDKGSEIAEVEAYDLELANAEKNGLSEDEINDLKARRKSHYDALDDDNKKKIDDKKYNTLAMLPPSDRSVKDLAGNAQVFVAGTVLADEVTQVTVRGPQSLEGMVVEAEANGRQVKSKTDKYGRVFLDLSSLGAVSAGTTVLLRARDSSGHNVANAQTTVQPQTGVPIRRPEIPKMPTQLRNGNIVTLNGTHLGADAQLVVGNQAQETLAASSRQLTSFVSAPTGSQPLYVVTPFGVSQSQTCQVYNFSMTASKTTITRGEHITATATYEGLAPGSQVLFTNRTPTVVQMQSSGAVCSNLTCTVKIAQPQGTIVLDLLGQSAGRFVIDYEVSVPK
jgi:hypothetical protein